jgi:hypothetical protein
MRHRVLVGAAIPSPPRRAVAFAHSFVTPRFGASTYPLCGPAATLRSTSTTDLDENATGVETNRAMISLVAALFGNLRSRLPVAGSAATAVAAAVTLAATEVARNPTPLAWGTPSCRAPARRVPMFISTEQRYTHPHDDGPGQY